MSTLGIKYEVFVGEDKKFVVFKNEKLLEEHVKDMFIPAWEPPYRTAFYTGKRRFWTPGKTHYWDVEAWVEVSL